MGAWLDYLCLTEYKDIFIGHDVRGAELIHLERRDLKVAHVLPSRLLQSKTVNFNLVEDEMLLPFIQDLGVTKVGHIKRILQGIRELNRNSSASEA